ncbi:MAG: NAD(P)-binding domain-containing protein, partial [Xanthobacteraceae bacterium]
MTDGGPSADLRSFSGLLVLVGAGKMGGALLDGWLRLGLNPKNVAVLEPQPAPELSTLVQRGLKLNPDPKTLAGVAAMVIAVKPQVAAQAVPALAPLVSPSTVAVSIMAGRTLHFLAAALNRPCAL